MVKKLTETIEVTAEEKSLLFAAVESYQKTLTNLMKSETNLAQGGSARETEKAVNTLEVLKSTKLV
jgi:hypothetical protein